MKANRLKLKGPYPVRHYADIIHLEGAKAMAAYDQGWYAASPAVTVNRYGKGEAYYLASRNNQEFLSDFYGVLAGQKGLRRVIAGKIPHGVEVCERADEKRRFLFLTNFRESPRTVSLGRLKGKDLASGKKISRLLRLKPFQAVVLEVS